MTSEQFQVQLGRLTEQFGKAAYGTERCKLLWQEVQSFDYPWLRGLVDKFIGESRQAPLLPEFREQISHERGRMYRIEKAQHTKDASDFYSGVYQPDDVKVICQYIVKRLQGNVPDSDYATFLKHLNEAAQISPKVITISKCSLCHESGLTLDSTQTVYRCYCTHGLSRAEKYPIYDRQLLGRGSS